MAAISKKLDNCEVCAKNIAKYTCPKCEVRTCGLSCINIHKKELDCSGVRDETKFIPLNSFTDLDLLSDYRLLENIGRSVENFKRNPAKKFTRYKNCAIFLEKLKHAAHNKGIDLEFMPQNFSRHKKNTTYLNWKTNEFFWRVEFIFPQADNTKWSLDKVLDNKRLSVVLEEILNFDIRLNDNEQHNNLSVLYKKLIFYRACGITGLKALLKAEKVQKSDTRFYELDLSLSLEENLKQKTIIEFPVIYIILKDHSDMFEIIDSDDEEIKAKPSSNLRRKSNFENRSRIGHKSNKNKVDSTVNYFFCSEHSDLEEESTSDATYLKSDNQEFYIPDYNELVKMK
ncbi:PREDICTED: box C/D snoRNA protein 1 [Ceratosolen solmsi marchali]|uniref:Box C/D snoRNA protein 1 n=1 Tax=Ceratosolen solmsi marchali TaxID=326594 RepID=A0AAJ7E371_9HYME|nr:PREDICTED: box C/D snoRNA protein 1 [Ceratosolen solmsi marchali]